MLQQEEQSLALAISSSSSSTYSVDVVLGIIGRVILDNPVNIWEVKTSLCNISAEEDALLSLTELKVG
jgi:hypothetical protein